MYRTTLLAIFKRHRGSMGHLARELGIELTVLSRWFAGNLTSARIEAAVVRRAEALLAEEQQQQMQYAQLYPRLSRLAQVQAA